MLFFEDGDLVVVGLFMGSCVRIKKTARFCGLFLYVKEVTLIVDHNRFM